MSESYLNSRIQVFKTFCANCLENQTNQNFHWLILHDESLEEKYLIQLKNITKNIKYAYFCPYNHEEGCNSFIYMQNNYSTKTNGLNLTLNSDVNNWQEDLDKVKDIDYIITTRLDDDDSLSSNAIDIIQNELFNMDQLPLKYVAFDKGLKWFPNNVNQKGVFYINQINTDNRLYYYPIAIGLSMIINLKKIKNYQTIYHYDHSLIPRNIQKIIKENTDEKEIDIHLLIRRINFDLFNWIYVRHKNAMFEYSKIKSEKDKEYEDYNQIQNLFKLNFENVVKFNEIENL